MRDPELVARAQRATTRLESASEQWRARHGLAVAPGQPVVSYAGYSLEKPVSDQLAAWPQARRRPVSRLPAHGFAARRGRAVNR